MFQNKLYDIVLKRFLSKNALSSKSIKTYTELIPHQTENIIMQPIEQRARLWLLQILKYALKHSTTERVCRQFKYAAAKRLYEVQTLRSDAFDYLLDYLKTCKVRTGWIREGRKY